MKKLTLAAAIAASLSSGAFAAVNATFTAPQMVVAGFDITAGCPAGSSTFTIGGVNAGQIQMGGNICMEPNGPGNAPFIRLGFHTVTGAVGAGGTTFSGAPSIGGGGSIQIDVQTTSGWMPYAVVDVFTTPLDCTNATGIVGLQQTSPTTLGTPGFVSGGVNQAICDTTLFGTAARMYIGP